ncbi:MarR family transcriptional regulator [Motilibacter sp. K478]|nr:helix-turn-helix domain-containing protein [Motilibacter aurantiacus]NHC44525.1 MarR family transcriptional regulator [Motilibacter aurantiacus]
MPLVADREWTFLSNHGHVLVAIAQDPEARVVDIAERVGITDRAVQAILNDLESTGYVRRTREGRRNTYRVLRGGRLRHPQEKKVRVGGFLELFGA